MESPIYRVVTMVAGPRLLLKGAQRRWEQLHRGVTLKAHLEDSDTAGRLELTFPDGLFSYEFVGGMGYAFKALLEANRTLPVHQQMTEFSPTRAVFVADWSPGAAERWSSVPPISGRPGSLPGARPISVPPPPKVPSGLSQDRDGGGSSEP